MNIKQNLIWGTKKLKNNKNASLDATFLLSDIIKKPKEFLYTYPEKKLTKAQEKKYKAFVTRRAKNEPIAYIIGKKEFYGFEFLVNKGVLIPRGETETLIEQVKNPKNIIDVGLGSGAIAITLKKLFPKAQVYGTEISPRAIILARKNAKHLGANIMIKKGDLLSPFLHSCESGNLEIPHQVRDGQLIITANLPYLSQKEWQKTKPQVKNYEPKGALIGGKNGWELYEKLFQQIKKLKLKNATLILEMGYDQKPIITKLLKKYLKPKKIEAVRDLSGKWRIIKCKI